MTNQEYDEIFVEKPNQIHIDEYGNAVAAIVDEECDPIICSFSNDDCVELDTSEYSYITLSLRNLDMLKKLIIKAQIHYSKNQDNNL